MRNRKIVEVNQRPMRVGRVVDRQVALMSPITQMDRGQMTSGRMNKAQVAQSND